MIENGGPYQRSALRVVIPLLHDTEAPLDRYFYSVDGLRDPRHVWWITPIAVFDVSGWNVFEFKILPTMAAYADTLTFEIWDKLRQSRPKLVGVVKIDAQLDTYRAMLEPYYQKFNFSMEFNLHRANRIPDASQAYRNNTHHGDWAYKEKL